MNSLPYVVLAENLSKILFCISKIKDIRCYPNILEITELVPHKQTIFCHDDLPYALDNSFDLDILLHKFHRVEARLFFLDCVVLHAVVNQDGIQKFHCKECI